MIRDYDIDEKGTIRPFIQELLRRKGIQTVGSESSKGEAPTDAIIDIKKKLKSKKRTNNFFSLGKIVAFIAAAFVIPITMPFFYDNQFNASATKWQDC